jgi:hypothetical protein
MANGLLAAKLTEIEAAPAVRISGTPIALTPVPPIIPVLATAQAAAGAKPNGGWFSRHFKRAGN